MARYVIHINKDGTKRMEVIPENPDKVEERKKLLIERRKIAREKQKITDEELAKSKGFENFSEYRKARDSKWLKNKGFKNYYEYQSDLSKKRGFKNNQDYLNKWAQNKGYKDFTDYKLGCSKIKEEDNPEHRKVRNDKWAKSKGFENYNDYRNVKGYEKGEHFPMSENMECPLWLGVHIAEGILPEIYGNVERMPLKNKGFDAICGKQFKIDVKSSCLNIEYNEWKFGIFKNKIADLFVMFAFDNRVDLNLLCGWIIKGDKIVRERRFSEFETFHIKNDKDSLEELKEYQLSEDLLNKARDICKKFKDEQNCNIE